MSMFRFVFIVAVFTPNMNPQINLTPPPNLRVEKSPDELRFVWRGALGELKWAGYSLIGLLGGVLLLVLSTRLVGLLRLGWAVVLVALGVFVVAAAYTAVSNQFNHITLTVTPTKLTLQQKPFNAFRQHYLVLEMKEIVVQKRAHNTCDISLLMADGSQKALLIGLKDTEMANYMVQEIGRFLWE